MGCDRKISDAVSQAGAATPAPARRKVSYSEPAALTDVLFDQLDYLLAHARRRCASDCIDCIRLRQVEGWLLLPFRNPISRRRAVRAPAA